MDIFPDSLLRGGEDLETAAETRQIFCCRRPLGASLPENHGGAVIRYDFQAGAFTLK